MVTEPLTSVHIASSFAIILTGVCILCESSSILGFIVGLAVMFGGCFIMTM
jgi:hypothetical protein